MPATRYSFSHRAVVAAAPEHVADLLLDLEHYPDWWPQIRAVASLGPDDALVICRSLLPYDLELHLTPVSRTPGHLEVRIQGPMTGFARWQLSPSGTGTDLQFTQQVEVTHAALVAASYVAKPLLRMNHHLMMRGCVQGLTHALASPA